MKNNQNQKTEQNKVTISKNFTLEETIKDFEENFSNSPALVVAVGGLFEEITYLQNRVEKLEQGSQAAQSDDDVVTLPQDVIDLLKADVACFRDDCSSCPYYDIVNCNCTRIRVFEAVDLLKKYGVDF